MTVLYLKRVTNLADYFHHYKVFLKSQGDDKKATADIAKLKTGLLRYVAPDYGFPVKLNGNLSASDAIDGLKFLEQIPICQAVYLLEAQERVFEKYGNQVTSNSRRVYRSSLKKCWSGEKRRTGGKILLRNLMMLELPRCSFSKNELSTGIS